MQSTLEIKRELTEFLSRLTHDTTTKITKQDIKAIPGVDGTTYVIYDIELNVNDKIVSIQGNTSVHITYKV